jgi:uncharacterized repeat protein (TIGR01451 family)
VTFTLYNSGNCTGTVVGQSQTVLLDSVTGQAESSAVTLSPTSTQSYSYRAHYNGGDGPGQYPAQDAACEPFTVTYTPPPPSPKTDLAIVKDATAQVTLGSNGQASIVYDVVVRNNGPDPAVAVTVSDPAPSGVVFVGIAQQPGQGSCSIGSGGALLSCSLGTLAVGQSVALKVNATVSVTGTVNNCATTVTTTAETNAANNTDCAPTLVVAPVTPPPTPKPKPKPKPEICNTVTVTEKILKGNGKAQKINVKVTQGKKGVAGASVKISGPGVSKTVKSGKNGKVTVTVTPSKPGIIKIEIQNKKACNTQRIGVVGVYEPPVTG